MREVVVSGGRGEGRDGPGRNSAVRGTLLEGRVLDAVSGVCNELSEIVIGENFLGTGGEGIAVLTEEGGDDVDGGAFEVGANGTGATAAYGAYELLSFERDDAIWQASVV